MEALSFVLQEHWGRPSERTLDAFLYSLLTITHTHKQKEKERSDPNFSFQMWVGETGLRGVAGSLSLDDIGINHI